MNCLALLATFSMLLNCNASKLFVKSRISTHSSITEQSAISKSRLECASLCLTQERCIGYTYVEDKCSTIEHFHLPLDTESGPLTEFYVENEVFEYERDLIHSGEKSVFQMT